MRWLSLLRKAGVSSKRSLETPLREPGVRASMTRRVEGVRKVERRLRFEALTGDLVRRLGLWGSWGSLL